MNQNKLKMLLIALAAIFLTYNTQPTLAYYSTIGKATNVITSGDIQLIIHEKTADGSDFPEEGVYIIPGDIVSKRVTVENVCTHPFYLRVSIVSGSTKESLSAEDVFELDLNTTHWTVSDDGYIYYNTIVQPGETTVPLFTQVEIVGSKVSQKDVGSMLTLTVNAQAVQSEHNPADHPWDASGWPAE